MFLVRTVKIQGDLKSRIEECRDSCTALMSKLSRRINVDTNTRVKKIEDGLHQTGTFLLFDDVLSLISFMASIGRTLEAIKDDKLGTFEFLFSSIIKIIRSTPQRKGFTRGYPRLTAPEVAMKLTTNVKTTPASGFSTKSDSSSGKQTLGFFGLRERVSFSVSYLNLRVKLFYSRMWQKHSIVSPSLSIH